MTRVFVVAFLIVLCGLAAIGATSETRPAPMLAVVHGSPADSVMAVYPPAAPLAIVGFCPEDMSMHYIRVDRQGRVIVAPPR